MHYHIDRSSCYSCSTGKPSPDIEVRSSNAVALRRTPRALLALLFRPTFHHRQSGPIPLTCPLAFHQHSTVHRATSLHIFSLKFLFYPPSASQAGSRGRLTLVEMPTLKFGFFIWSRLPNSSTSNTVINACADFHHPSFRPVY